MTLRNCIKWSWQRLGNRGETNETSWFGKVTWRKVCVCLMEVGCLGAGLETCMNESWEMTTVTYMNFVHTCLQSCTNVLHQRHFFPTSLSVCHSMLDSCRCSEEWEFARLLKRELSCPMLMRTARLPYWELDCCTEATFSLQFYQLSKHMRS